MKNERSGIALYAQYKRMAMKLAWKYWKQLPTSAKMWIDPEDMIAEAVLHVVTRISDIYNPKKSSMSTFVYTSVGSVLFNFVLAQRNSKRFGWNISIEDEACPVLMKRDEVFQLVEAKMSLEKIFVQASPKLRSEIGRWFSTERLAPRYSKESKRVIMEFAFLAKRHQLTPSDCRLLLRSGIWMT